MALKIDSVRDLLREFPLGMHVTVNDEDYVVTGAAGDDVLLLMPDNGKDYDDAMQRRKFVSAESLRKGEVRLLKEHRIDVKP